MQVPIELPEIPGYEYTGEYRKPLEGEYYLMSPSVGHAKRQLGSVVFACHHILEPVKPPLVFPDELLSWNIAGIAWDSAWCWYASKPDPAIGLGWQANDASGVLLTQVCPWLPCNTGYKWTETWIPHPNY